MRLQRTVALLVLLGCYLALGPLVLLLALGALLVPRVRDWLRPTRRVVAVGMAAAAALAGLVLVVPDGWLPVPPGPGALVTPRYVGRPALPRPVRLSVPQHPGLAVGGAATVLGDGWATGTYAWAGPLGESPDVDTAWYGREHCAELAVDGHGRLVALCREGDRPKLHVIDPDTLRPLAGKDLPAGPGGPCGHAFLLDDADRAVVATADRHVLVVGTDDAEGAPDLTTQARHDLSGRVPADDCLVAVLPDWRGRLWYATGDGRIGTVGDRARAATVLDLGEAVTSALAADRAGVYAVTTHAVYRLRVHPRTGRPVVAWRSSYDRGSERKPGQPGQGSGTAPTLLPGGLVAIADNADPTMHVVFLRRSDGALVCQAGVFGDDRGATGTSLVAVGAGVVVENNRGYSGPLSTALGRTTQPGLARVDVAGGRCVVRWTSAESAPSSVSKLSLANGLVYAYTKRHSWWGANAWYLTGIDARTGRTVFAVRTGLGALMDNDHSAVTLARDGSAYVATLGGLVRVRDRD
jgi:hypothetical protein